MTHINNWFDADGDNTFALDWDLNENSHVWEIGGFEGRWASQIWEKFHCHIRIFEPQSWAVQRMYQRFKDIEKIKIEPFGLWITDGEFKLGNFFTDGASMLKISHAENEICFFKNIHSVLYGEVSVDLALMNIEGAEYTLIPELIKTGAISKFKNFWCQFHPGLLGVVDEPDYKAMSIMDGMERTHEIMWSFYPTAVAWRRK